MPLPPNKIRANETNPQTKPIDPEADQRDADNHSAIADSYRLGWMGQLHDAIEREADQWQELPADFKPGDHIPPGYEAYASAFGRARTPEEIPIIKAQIDENLAIRRRQGTRGGLTTIGADVVSAIADPINLVPIARIEAVGWKAGAAEGVAKIGSVGAGTAVVQTGLDATSTPEEMQYGVAGSLLLGGAIGGVVGRNTGKALGRATGPARPSTLAPPANAPLGSRFGRRARPQTSQGPGSANHQGVDLLTPMNTPLRAGGDGVVSDVTTVQTGHGYGISVTIDYGGGVKAKVAHLSRAEVQVGDPVRKGEVIAYSGNTGKSTGPHTHYEVTINGKAVNPLATPIDVPGRSVDGSMSTIGRTPDAMIDTVNLFDNLEPPRAIDIDGRGVPVHVGKTDTGAMASYVRGRTAAEMAEEQVAEMERAAMSVVDDGPLPIERPPSRYDGIGVMPLKEAQALARSFAEEEGVTGAKALKKRTAEIMAEMRAYIHGTALERVSLAEGVNPEDPMLRARLAARYRARALAADAAGAPADVVDALEAAADELTDGIDTALTREADDLYAARQAYRRSMDPDLREMNADLPGADPHMTRGQMAEAMRSSGHYSEDLPFGLHYSTDGGHFRDGDHLQVDSDAILASFKHKPWTKPNIEGVAPLPEDTFTSPQEWLNFVVNHEVEHTVNPRREGEALADYENRINQRALEELRAGNEPFSPSASRLEALAIAPTPMGQMARLVADKTAAIHQSIQDLAGDFAVMMARNKLGGASTPGGSVFQRAHRWLARQYVVRDSIRREYLDLIGVGPKGTRMQVEKSVLAQRLPFIGAKARGLPTIHDFRAEVARAIVGGAEVSPQAARAAAEFTRIMTDVETHARELGLFQSVKGLTARADRLERRAAGLDIRIDRLRDLDPDTAADMATLSERFRTEAADLREQASKEVMPYREERYYPRHWNIDALEADKARAIEMFRRGYAREGHPNPEAAAHGAYETVTLEPSGDFAAPGTPSSLKHRSIPVSNEEAFDFIVQDPELVMSIYLRRMGAMIEMTRRYGDAFGLDEIDMLRVDLKERGVPRETAEKALQLWEDARDRVVGAFHGKDPLSWDNRAARALKNMVNLAVMGKVLWSQVSDIAKVMTVQGLGAKRMVTGRGPAGLLGGIYAGLVGDISRFNTGGIAKQAGEALELVTARATARQIESDSALIVTRQTRFERWLATAQTPFFVGNGMIPFTVILKEWAGVVAAHNIIDDARIVAAAVREGGEPDAKALARLAQNGIDRVDAQIIADMPTELGESGLHLANVEAWPGERGMRARDLLLAAVNGEVRRSVVTPGPLDRPAIFDGVFHTKKGREAGLQRVFDAQRGVDEARSLFGQFARRAETDPERVAALEALQRAQGELTMARRAVGQAGRLEAPLASLPFQMHSFAMASGAKTMHGLLSGADRNRVGGLISLLVAGGIATWLKNSDHWDKMSWPDFIAQSVDRSGISAWLLDLGKAVDTTLDLQLMPGNEFDPEGERYSDEIGGLGAAPGLAASLIEPFVSEKADWNDKVGAVRRVMPYQNMIWLDGTLDKIQRAISARDDQERDGVNDEVPSDMTPQEITEVHRKRRSLGRWGIEVPDLRQPATEPGPPAPMPEEMPVLPQPPNNPLRAKRKRRRIAKPVLL